MLPKSLIYLPQKLAHDCDDYNHHPELGATLAEWKSYVELKVSLNQAQLAAPVCIILFYRSQKKK